MQILKAADGEGKEKKIHTKRSTWKQIWAEDYSKCVRRGSVIHLHKTDNEQQFGDFTEGSAPGDVFRNVSRLRGAWRQSREELHQERSVLQCVIECVRVKLRTWYMLDSMDDLLVSGCGHRAKRFLHVRCAQVWEGPFPPPQRGVFQRFGFGRRPVRF